MPNDKKRNAKGGNKREGEAGQKPPEPKSNEADSDADAWHVARTPEDEADDPEED